MVRLASSRLKPTRTRSTSARGALAITARGRPKSRTARRLPSYVADMKRVLSMLLTVAAGAAVLVVTVATPAEVMGNTKWGDIELGS